MCDTNYYQRNRKTVLDSQKDYCESNKKVWREIAKHKYRKLYEEGKNIKRQYRRNRYKNISEGKKQRLKESQKNYRQAY